MEKTKKAVCLAVAFLVIALFLPQVLAGSMGLGPVELTGCNKRDSLIIGTVSLINGYDVPKYGILSLEIPYTNKDTWQPVQSEQRNIRVVCRDCKDTMVRYEAINDYNYPDSPLVGTCEKCGSSNLIFYELLPRDELQQMSLEANSFTLRKEGNAYITTEKIPAGATCNVDILYDASKSYTKENEGKYWEARVKATLKEELEGEGFGVLAGIGIRVLIEFKLPLFIDVPDVVEKGEEFTAKITCGNLEGTWREIPDDVPVSFLGITKSIDENGSVTFIAPTTKEDSTYDISAEGSKYLSVTEIVSTGNVSAEAKTDDGNMLFAGIVAFWVILAIIAVSCLFISKRRKELEDG